MDARDGGSSSQAGARHDAANGPAGHGAGRVQRGAAPAAGLAQRRPSEAILLLRCGPHCLRRCVQRAAGCQEQRIATINQLVTRFIQIKAAMWAHGPDSPAGAAASGPISLTARRRAALLALRARQGAARRPGGELAFTAPSGTCPSCPVQAMGGTDEPEEGERQLWWDPRL
ncbi:unnamed protein product [Urochloa humidicola]